MRKLCITDCGNSDSQYAIDSFALELEFISSEINFSQMPKFHVVALKSTNSVNLQ